MCCPGFAGPGCTETPSFPSSEAGVMGVSFEQKDIGSTDKSTFCTLALRKTETALFCFSLNSFGGFGGRVFKDPGLHLERT